MKDKSLMQITNFIAETSIGSSTIRNMGPAGNIQLVRNFLKVISIQDFLIAAHFEPTYKKWLNKQTSKLIKETNFRGDGFGPARKCINIYLRNIIYNSLVCAHFGLIPYSREFNNVLSHLEIPIDSFSAKGIMKDAKKVHNCPPLPGSWKTIMILSSEQNEHFQIAAKIIADSKQTARVNLDFLYFRKNS
jgi:hypothetical protein